MTAQIIQFPTKAKDGDALDQFVARMEAWRNRPATDTERERSCPPADHPQEEKCRE